MAASPPEEIPRSWIAGLLLAAAALRLCGLERQSFWYDEAVSVQLASASLYDLLSGQAKDLGNPPLYPALLALWTAAFGPGDAVVRALGALFGVATVPLVLFVGRRLLPARAAFAGALLFAAAPFQIQMAQEARGYTLLTLAGVGAVAALLRALEQPERWRWWLLAGLALGATLLAHYFGLFLAVALAAYLVLAHRRERALLARASVTFGVAALCFSFWLPSLLAQLSVAGNLARSADSWYLHLGATPLVFGVGTTLLWKDSATGLRVAAGLLAALAFLVAVAAGSWRLRHDRGGRLLGLWLALPLALPALLSLLASPLYNTRYVILASVPFALLAAAGLAALPRRAALACAGTMAATMIASHASYLASPVKDDWRAAVRFVEEHQRPGDLLLFEADHNETAFARYARQPARRVRLVPPPAGAPGDRPWGADGAGVPAVEVSDLVRGAARVWLVISDARPEAAARARALLAGRTPGAAARLRGIAVERFDSGGP